MVNGKDYNGASGKLYGRVEGYQCPIVFFSDVDSAWKFCNRCEFSDFNGLERGVRDFDVNCVCKCPDGLDAKYFQFIAKAYQDFNSNLICRKMPTFLDFVKEVLGTFRI